MKLVSLWSKFSLGLQLLIALILGVLVALIWPQFSAFYQFLGQAFISLINMVIIPLVFPVVVVAVAGVIGKKSFGKLLSKSLLYFFGVTTAITFIFVFAAYYLGFGQGVNIGQAGASIDGIAKSIQYIIKRLDNRRTYPALHTGRQLAVKTGKEPSPDRR